MPLAVTQVVIDMLRFKELDCPSTNQVLPFLEQLTPWTRDRVKQLQSPYFVHPLTRIANNPTTPTQGNFVLSPVSLASRDQDDGPVEQNDQHLWSHRKIGDCEQSKLYIITDRTNQRSWPDAGHLRHQYGIFCGESQTCTRETPLGPGAKDISFRRLGHWAQENTI